MAYNEQPPEWNAPGVEPPLSKKNEGWGPNEHPPADYWNWQMYRVFKVLQELQQKALEAGDVHAADVPIDDALNLINATTIEGALQEIAAAYPINAMSRQAIINGNFDVWQRGTSFTNPSGYYTVDRWRLEQTNAAYKANLTLSQQSVSSQEILNSRFYCRLNNTVAVPAPSGDNVLVLDQPIENGVRLLCGAGKMVTVSFLARSSIDGKKLGIYLAQVYGTGGSPSSAETVQGAVFTLTSTFSRYSFTFNTAEISDKTFGSNNDDYLTFHLVPIFSALYATLVGAAGTSEGFPVGNIDIGQVQLNAGDQPLPFQPRSFVEELALCQRYYEKSYDYASAPGSIANNGAVFGITADNTNTGLHGMTVFFKARKRVVPTVNIWGVAGAAGQVYDGNADRVIASGAVVSFPGETQFRTEYTVTGANTPKRVFHYAADAEL